jgi:hypothetical protein
MGQSDLSDDDVSEPEPVMDENQKSRVVLDFTVGPAGVGPPTSVTPARADEPLQEPRRPD